MKEFIKNHFHMVFVVILTVLFCVFGLSACSKGDISNKPESPVNPEKTDKTLELPYSNQLLFIELLSNERGKIEFIAPENGEYVFETSGDYKNTLFATDTIKGADKADGINQELKVVLKRGQVFTIFTEAVNDTQAEYYLGVKFTPNEIKMWDDKLLTVRANETEFVSILNENYAAYDYEIESEMELAITVTDGYNAVVNTYKSKNPNGSFLAISNQRYYIKIQNNNSVDANLQITLKDVESLDCGKKQKVNCITNKIYKIQPEYNADYLFEITGTNSVKSTISGYEKTGNKITLQSFLSSCETYYLEISPFTQTDIEVVCRPNPQSIYFETKVLGNDSDYLFGFKITDTDIRVNIESDAEVKIFDESMDPLELPALVKQGKQYYIGVHGVINDSVSVVPVTSTTSGSFGSDGFVFLKVVPNMTCDYKVEGCDSVQWFGTNSLYKINNNLVAGNIYYVRLKGKEGEIYNVRVLPDPGNIALNVNQTVNSKTYALEITNDGMYGFRTFCANGISSTVKVYSEDETLIETFCADKKEKEITLTQGRYFIEIIINGGDNIGIKVNQKL